MKTIINYTLVFVLIAFVQNSYAQDSNSDRDKIKTKKEALIEKYTWTKDIFDQSEKDLNSIYEYVMPNGMTYIVVDSKNAITLFDSAGNKYCVDHETVNCREFYKLTKGDLGWTND